MTRDAAKEILALYRPGTADAEDPFFGEALQQAETDPVLGAWLGEQQSFDRAVSECLSVSLPVELRTRKLARGSRWWNRTMRPAEFGIAALIALLLAISGMWLHAKGTGVDPLRDQVVEQTWSGRRHVDLKTSNLAEIRRFIAAHDVRGDFKLPPELAEMPAHGCKLLHVNGRQVPYICFVDGSKHLHLVILDSKVWPARPLMESPEFAKWHNWTTATWSQGDMTFVLTGLKPSDFVKKFRKERQWTWGG